MHPVSCTNTHHDVTDLVNHGMVKNTKTSISRERNIIFLRNKKILNLCVRWHILRSYRFVAVVIFNLKEWHQNAQLQIFFQANITVGKRLKICQGWPHLRSGRFIRVFYKTTTCQEWSSCTGLSLLQNTTFINSCCF